MLFKLHTCWHLCEGLQRLTIDSPKSTNAVHFITLKFTTSLRHAYTFSTFDFFLCQKVMKIIKSNQPFSFAEMPYYYVIICKLQRYNFYFHKFYPFFLKMINNFLKLYGNLMQEHKKYFHKKYYYL